MTKKKPTMNPKLQERLDALRRTRKPARGIPLGIIHKCIDTSGGTKANLFRLLFYKYGYTVNEIYQGLDVKTQSHVYNAVHAEGLDPSWVELQRECKKPKASKEIAAEIAAAEIEETEGD